MNELFQGMDTSFEPRALRIPDTPSTINYCDQHGNHSATTHPSKNILDPVANRSSPESAVLTDVWYRSDSADPIFIVEIVKYLLSSGSWILYNRSAFIRTKV